MFSVQKTDPRADGSRRSPRRITLGLLGLLALAAAAALVTKGCRSGPGTQAIRPPTADAEAVPIAIRDRRGHLLAYLDPASDQLIGSPAAYVRLAVEQLRDRRGAAMLRIEGLRIDTPFDDRLQRQARRAVQHHLAEASQDGGPAAQGTLVAMAARSRQVLAWTDQATGQGAESHWDLRPHPAGTTLKPFLAAAALRSGTWRPEAKPIETAAAAPASPPDWTPLPLEGFQTVTMRMALVGSSSTPMVRAATDLDPDLLRLTWRSFGLPEHLSAVEAVTGRARITPLALTNAYATLATAGLAADPLFTSAWRTPAGQGERLAADGQRLALMPDQARLLARLLRRDLPDRSAVHGWPSAVARGSRLSGERSAWFVGYQDDLVVAVWVQLPGGAFDPGGVDPLRVAEGIWMDFMSQARRVS